MQQRAKFRDTSNVDLSQTEVRAYLSTAMNALRLVGGLTVSALGALFLAEGVLGWVNNTSLFFEGVNPTFKFVLGFITIVLADSVTQKSKK